MVKQRQRLSDRKSKVAVSDVARLAQVSDSTVSRIMRNQGLIADATGHRVMDAAGVLGYVPNRIAGSLASHDSRLVGVVIPSLFNIVFPEVLQGVNVGLAGTNRQSVISVTDYDLEKAEIVVRNLLAWQPAAVLIAGSTHTGATRKMLDQSGIRIIEFLEIDHPPIDVAVGLSHVAAGVAAERHLIARGYRRFGYLVLAAQPTFVRGCGMTGCARHWRRLACRSSQRPCRTGRPRSARAAAQTADLRARARGSGCGPLQR